MLKNKIYRHITFELLRTFFTILFAFTLIAWTVRAVNYLNLIVNDAHSVSTYLFYSLLNIVNIITKFIRSNNQKELDKVLQKTNNPKYQEKAPQALRDKDTAIITKHQNDLRQLTAFLEALAHTKEDQ